MKTSLKANLLKHLIAKKEEGGFTLIELLVVIIIIGILAAIALPSFLNQANKAKQSEAKTYLGSINRGQQAYFLERDQFTTNVSRLGLGIQSQTENYVYAAGVVDANTNTEGYAQALPNDGTGALDNASTLKAYQGLYGTGVTDKDNPQTAELTTLAVLCEAELTPKQGGDGTTGTTLTAPNATTYDPNNGPGCTLGSLAGKYIPIK